jgi:hypothetical protein
MEDTPFNGPRPTVHEYEPYSPDMTRPPVVEYSPEFLRIRRADLPEVHTVHRLPHIHLKDAAGEEYAVHTMAGDSPRDLVLMGMHYIALGMALREQLQMEWDDKWTGPHPEGAPGWQEGHHSHD